MQPHRMGLGMQPSFGQGPSMGALAQQRQIGTGQSNFVPPQKAINMFIGSISGGITDTFMNQLLALCGPIRTFKRLITPANKPQGFGFAEFEHPEGAIRATELLTGVELPALEDGVPDKKLLVKADEKTKIFLDAWSSQRMKTSDDEAKDQASRDGIQKLIADLKQLSGIADGAEARERLIIPPHLHDLQEHELPETQRGLVISEIAMFRERSAKKGLDKTMSSQPPRGRSGSQDAGPRQREWGRPQGGPNSPSEPRGGYGGPQSYNKPVGFVREESRDDSDRRYSGPTRSSKTDEELQRERDESRRRQEDDAFRNYERRYEPKERSRLQGLERRIDSEEKAERSRLRLRDELKRALDEWDDDAAAEPYYYDRQSWRRQREQELHAEEDKDRASRGYEEREAENLRRESEAFLARQMEEMRSLADEQRKAGMLLDDGAPVKLNVSLNAPTTRVPQTQQETSQTSRDKTLVFGADDEEEEGARKRKAPLVKLEFADSGEKAKERLEKIRDNLSTDKETIFKTKVRWDGITDTIIDRKLQPLVKRLVTKYLEGIEDDHMESFVVEHLKDHKGPAKLIEGVEEVLESEAEALAFDIYRQLAFESAAYNEGLRTGDMTVV